MIKRKLFSVLFFMSGFAMADCWASREEGFVMEGRSDARVQYECSSILFPHFSHLNYVIEQGITCNNEQWPSKVVMNCENRSRQEREVKNVQLVCCDSAGQ